MTSPLIRQEVRATVNADEHRPSSGVVTLDALAAPYASGSVELPLNDDTALEDFDPRNNVRMSIVASDTLTSTSRTFDVGVRSREVNHDAKTVMVEIASDEALLQDYATLTLDTGARAQQTSLRAVCNYVLATIGATLSAGAVDADVTAYWAVTNQLPNPSFETDLTGWSPGFGATSFTRPAVGGSPGGGFGLRWVASASSTAVVAAPGPASFPVTPGRSYVWAVYAYGGAARTAYARLQWFSSNGTVLIGEASGAGVVLDVTGIWKRLTVIGVAPPGATTVQPIIYIPSTANGEAFIADAGMLYEGTELIPYFDGSTPSTSTYTYKFSGTAHASPSSRTPVVSRPPDLFEWKPGTTAWDFLQPLVTPSGLRLFCDELRVWRLIDPSTYEVPGFVWLSSVNAVDATDTISRDDAEVFATGVVVRYVWEDRETGDTRTAYDSAGTPEKVVVIDYARAYPGPGAAAAILARRNGTGRTQDVAALNDWATTPGNVASITLPDTPEQQGKVSSVRFSLGDDAVMSVGTRGLIDIPPGSWLAWTPADQAWQDVADAVTWNSLPA